ncbi:phosphopantetheine-binding protein [Dactylosporangium sp. NPDC048998]|uniref:phosphopantetheine-binding protein n=1 Tax=Dactylosporangium sp. NPDC048998 TaxID=3363976 RepID=UPI003719A11C
MTATQPPRSTAAEPTLAALLALCAELLPGSAPTAAANLFALGADSATLTALAAAVAQRWGVEVDLTDLFDAEDLGEVHAGIAAALAGPARP